MGSQIVDYTDQILAGLVVECRATFFKSKIDRQALSFFGQCLIVLGHMFPGHYAIGLHALRNKTVLRDNRLPLRALGEVDQ